MLHPSFGHGPWFWKHNTYFSLSILWARLSNVIANPCTLNNFLIITCSIQVSQSPSLYFERRMNKWEKEEEYSKSYYWEIIHGLRILFWHWGTGFFCVYPKFDVFHNIPYISTQISDKVTNSSIYWLENSWYKLQCRSVGLV